uniref:Mastermind-like transcriptional coactivator 3 n=1 Tax=Esox lucius TaxID=8010 RepID=A0AAY5JZA5_ESOLU
MNPGQGVGQAGSGPTGPGLPPGGQGPGPVTSDLSPAEQLKAMAAQQRAKLMQQKQQQQQANWSPAGAPTSPYGSGPFSQQDKPSSPMMYPPQAFNPGPQGPLGAGMTPNNGSKAGAMNNYLPQNPHNHMGMMSQQQQTTNMAALSKQQQTAAMLSYNNTKPLSHFSAMGVDHMGQRMTPPMGSQVKNPMMPPYMQQGGGGVQGAGPGQTQGPIPGQTAHLSEEQKRMMLMKQKVLNQSMPYGAMQPHGQVGRTPFWICCIVQEACVGFSSFSDPKVKLYSVFFLSLSCSCSLSF